MILGPEFAQRYRGREMVALRLHSSDQKALACPISAVSTDRATPLPLPFRAAESYSDVSCGELRCVELGNTLCLYNPSTRAHRKLPPPSCPPRIGASIAKTAISVFVYGLGYDAAANDYKIIKAHRNLRGETELYSLRSDSWRKVVDCRKRILSCISDRDITTTFHTHKGVFVSGALHWLVRSYWLDGSRAAGIWVLSFDLSTEEFRKAAPPLLPERLIQSTCSTDQMDVGVLKGRMCVWENCGGRFSVWAMMEDDCSWSKDIEIYYSNIYPLCYSNLKPLYFYDSDGKAIKAVTSCTDIRKMFIYKDEGEEEIVEKKFGYGVVDSFTYVESLISPFPDHNYCHINREVEVERNKKVKREGRGHFIEDPWAAYRGKYPNPTYEEWKLILRFLVKFRSEDENFVEEDSKSWIGFKERLQRPNLRSSFLEFLRQVRESKGYDVDSDIDFSVSPSWKRFGFFIPRSLEVEKFYDEAMAASKFAVERINDHMCSMKRDNRYEVVSVEKLVSTTIDILLLTFTAKEISTADLENFQAMVSRAYSVFELKEWKFKPIPF